MRRSRRNCMLLIFFVAGCVTVFHLQFQYNLETKLKERQEEPRDNQGIIHGRKLPENLNGYSDIESSNKMNSNRDNEIYSADLFNRSFGTVKSKQSKDELLGMHKAIGYGVIYNSLHNVSTNPLQRDSVVLDSIMDVQDSSFKNSKVLANGYNSISNNSNKLNENLNVDDKLIISDLIKNESEELILLNSEMENVHNLNKKQQPVLSRAGKKDDGRDVRDSVRNKLANHSHQRPPTDQSPIKPAAQEVAVMHSDQLQPNYFEPKNSDFKLIDADMFANPDNFVKDSFARDSFAKESFAKDSFAKDTFSKDSSAQEGFVKDSFTDNLNELKFIPLPMKSLRRYHSGANNNSLRMDSGNQNTYSLISKSYSIPQSSDGIKIVSMSLYGSSRRYTVGAVRNAELIRRYFPGWTLRIYAISPASSSASRHPPLPQDIVETLRNLGADIQYVAPELDFVPPMMWRFLVADDLSVDWFIVRDSDSRLSERDASCVTAWTRSGKAFLSVRDHPSHAGYTISGGLWGGRPADLRNILRRSWIDHMKGLSANYLSDMGFLNDMIWPKVKDRHLYSCDSVSCDKWPSASPFPVERRGYEHVGAVYDENDLMRPVDVKILLQAGENTNCLPNRTSVQNLSRLKAAEADPVR